jgi:hypothetical protein
MATLLETKRKEGKKRAEWLKMVHADILEKHKRMLEVYGPARAKGFITVTINNFFVGLSWLNWNCYNYYVRQLKGAPEFFIAASTSDGESARNMSGPTISQNDNPLVLVNLNMSDAILTLPSWNVAPNNNADEGSVELSDEENTASSPSTAMDTIASHAIDERMSSLRLGGGGKERQQIPKSPRMRPW